MSAHHGTISQDKDKAHACARLQMVDPLVGSLS